MFPNLSIKIGDFGLAKEVDRSETSLKENVGTYLYQSPEQLENKHYNEKVDIYALGLIFLEMCFPFKSNADKVFQIDSIKERGDLPKDFEILFPEEAKVVGKMVSFDPYERYSAVELESSQEMKALRDKYIMFDN